MKSERPRFFMFMRVLLLIFCFALFSEEYQVHLATQDTNFSFYLTEMKTESQAFSDSYLSELEKILLFDLNQAGYFFQVFEKGGKAHFVLTPVLAKNQLRLDFLKVYSSREQSLPAVFLKGDLAFDRRQVHKLASSFLESALGRKSFFQSRILYSVREEKEPGKWTSEIWMSDWDGGNEQRITFENNYCVHPQFLSKDLFLYVSYKTGFPKLYSSSFKTGESKPFVVLRGNQLLPALSKNRKLLTFISDAAGRPDLFMQLLDSNFKPQKKPVQIFSFPRATQASSTFSPDGKQLAFVSDKDGTPRIYLIDLLENLQKRKRPKARLLTIKNRGNVSPSWSSDGKKIAYSAKTEEVKQIWMYDFETKKEKQLTFDGKDKENPYFALDNLNIVYNTENKDEAELYLINIKSLKPVKITSGPGRKRFAVFEEN